MSNVVRLTLRKSAESVIQNLVENHRDNKIKSIVVTYTYEDGNSGEHEMYVSSPEDVTPMIGMLELLKSDLVGMIKHYLLTGNLK